MTKFSADDEENANDASASMIGESELLSVRQSEILGYAAKGLTDRQIALLTGLAEGTVRTYWERIRARLDARSRSEAIAKHLLAAQQGLREELNSLREVLGQLPSFVWSAQPSGEVDYCNDWFARFSGRSVGECLGPGCRLLMPESELAHSAQRWREAQESGRGYTADVHFRNADGQMLAHRITLRPLFDATGIRRWIGSAYALDFAGLLAIEAILRP